MSMSSHVEHLQRRHQTLEHTINEEMKHPSSDHVDIAALKREKLRIKDEIARVA